MGDGTVAPNQGKDWYTAEVHSVLSGKRAIGAALTSGLTDIQRATLAGLATSGQLLVERRTHRDGSVEVAWSLPDTPFLNEYWATQDARIAGTLTDHQYWFGVGGLFGYSAADFEAFADWQASGEGCRCAQCYPAG